MPRLVPFHSASQAIAALDQLAAIPEEEMWLAAQKSARTPVREINVTD